MNHIDKKKLLDLLDREEEIENFAKSEMSEGVSFMCEVIRTAVESGRLNATKDAITMNELTNKIQQWAIDRNLHTADPNKQMLKLGEEFGELCQGMAKGNKDQIIDSIGDMYVVMTILSMQLGLDIRDCIAQAYDEIKDRKGKMIDGVFVKEEDLA